MGEDEKVDVALDPNRVYKTQMVKPSWQDQLKEMIIQKGFSTCLLCAVIYVLYAEMKAEIPNHLQAIKDGFVAVSEADRAVHVAEAAAAREARRQDTERHIEAVKVCIEGQRDEREKAREAAAQLERILTNKMGLVVKQVEENEKKIESLRDN
jgi:F0F1-type ATP synthase epsilon subunit